MKISSCRWSRKWPFCAFSATQKARTSTVAPLSCESVAPGIDAFHFFTHAGTRTAPTECDVSDSTQCPAAPFSIARRSSTCANAASDGGPSPTPLATVPSSSVLIHGLWTADRLGGADAGGGGLCHRARGSATARISQRPAAVLG